MPQQYTLEELLERFRSSDPDYFEDYNDKDLASFIFEQYPSYRKNVISNELPAEYPLAETGFDVATTYDPGIEDHIENMAKQSVALGGSVINTADHWLNRAYHVMETYSPQALILDDLLEEMAVSKASEVSPERAAQVREQFVQLGGPLVQIADQQWKEREVDNEAQRLRYKEHLEEWSKEADQQAYEKWVEDTPMDATNFFMPDMILRGVSSLAPSVVAAVGAGMVGGPLAAFGMMLGMEIGDERTAAMEYLVDEQGMDPSEASGIADQASIIYGGVAAAIEYFAMGKMLKFLGLDKVGKRMFGKKFADSILKSKEKWRLKNKLTPEQTNTLAKAKRLGYNFTSNEVVQSSQEGLQNTWQLMVEKSYKVYGEGKGMDYKESFDHFLGDFKQAITDPSTGQAAWMAASGMLPGAVIGGTRDALSREEPTVDLRTDETGKPTYDADDKKFDAERTAQEMYDEVKEEDIKIEKIRKEALTDAALVLRRYTANIGDFSQEELERGEKLEEVLGEDLTKPKVRAKWADAIASIVEDSPEAFEQAGIKREDIMPLLKDPAIEKRHPDLIPKIEELIAPVPEKQVEAPPPDQAPEPTQAPIPEEYFKGKPKGFDEAFFIAAQPKFEKAFAERNIKEVLREYNPAEIRSMLDLYEQGAVPLPAGVKKEDISDFRNKLDAVLKEGKGEPPEDKGPGGGVPPTGAPPAGEAPGFVPKKPEDEGGEPVHIPPGTGIKVGKQEELKLEPEELPVKDKYKEKREAVTTVKVFKGVDAVRKAEKAGEGINVLRKEGEEHFGNPFTSLKTKTRAEVQVATVEESISRFEGWLRGDADQDLQPKRRKWMLEQIDKGELSGQNLLYHKDIPKSHASVLAEFVDERAPLPKEIMLETMAKLVMTMGSEDAEQSIRDTWIGDRNTPETFIAAMEQIKRFAQKTGGALMPTGMPEAAIQWAKRLQKERAEGIKPIEPGEFDDVVLEDVHGDIAGKDITESKPSTITPEEIMKDPTATDIVFSENKGRGYNARTKQTGGMGAVTIDFAMTEKGSGSTKRNARKDGTYINVPVDNLGTIWKEGAVPGATDEVLDNAVTAVANAIIEGKVVNMAGHGLYKLDTTQKEIDNQMDGFFQRVFNLAHDSNAGGRIVTGGQTGFDEAAAKAAIKFGFEVEVVAPKGWLYRTSEGKDIADEESFKARFIPEPSMAGKIGLEEEILGILSKKPTNIRGVDFFPVGEGEMPYEEIVSEVPEEMKEGISFQEGGAMAIKRSPQTQKKHQMFIPGLTTEMVDKWQAGTFIQEAMPDLTPDQREFLISGIPPSEWEALRPPDDDFDPDEVTKADVEAEVKKLQQDTKMDKQGAMDEVIRKIKESGSTIREAVVVSAKQVLTDTPKDFKPWIKEFKKISDLENLYEDIKDDDTVKNTDAIKELVDEIALRYQRGGEDITSKMSIFDRGSRKVKRIEFKTNKRAILTNAKKDLLGNYPAKVMVNELTQNSFDAKATTLNVDLFQDNFDDDIEMVFEDNGSGMSPDEVETNLFVFGNRAKGEYDAGSYGQAKAAFMLFPKKFKITTIKDGVMTVAEGTSDDLLDGSVEIVSTHTTRANGTKFEFILDATDNNPNAYNYAEALESQIKAIKRPIKAIVRTNAAWDNAIETNEYSSSTEINVVKPTLKLDYKGSEIEISFDKVAPYGWKGMKGYGITNHTLNKGLPLPELKDEFNSNLSYNKPNFIINVNFKKTPLVDSKDYPFIRNRSAFNAEVESFIQTEISKVLNVENKRALDLNIKDLQDAIDNAPIFGGVKIVLPELVETKDKLAVHTLLAKQQSFLSRIGELFGNFNRVLKDAGYKTIDLVITVDPSVHGWRPNIEGVKGLESEVYAINPFAMENADLKNFIAAHLEPEGIAEISELMIEFRRLRNELRDDNFSSFTIAHDAFGGDPNIMLEEDFQEKLFRAGDDPSFRLTSLQTKADVEDLLNKHINYLEKKFELLKTNEAERLYREKGPQWRAAMFVHTLVHEFAHNWGKGHDADHSYKIAEIYMKVSHKELAKLEADLEALFQSTGVNYENIQKELKEVYKEVDKRAVGFREELAVGGLPESSGKDGRAEDSNPLTGEIRGAVREVIAHTGKWHELRRIFQEAWTRVQEIHRELHGDLGQKVAINKYIRLMNDKLPFWAKDAFRDWYVDAFDLKKEEAWTDLDDGGATDYFLDEYETDKVLGTLLSEMREGLDEAGEETLDLRYLTRLNAVIDRALGIALPLATQRQWHAKVHQYDTADKWIDATLEEYTKLSPDRLTEWKRDKLKLKYHSLKNTIRTNRADESKNQRHNMFVEMSKDGDLSFQVKNNKNVKTKKENPQFDRNFLTEEDDGLIWLQLKDVLDKKTWTDASGRPQNSVQSRYNVLSETDLQLFDIKLLQKNMVVAFIRGETSLAIAKITKEHLDLAQNSEALKRFWELEGLTEKQIKNMMSQNSIQWRASQIAAYSAVKRHYPEFMDDSLANVFKRLKIPFTPAIRLDGFRKVTVKVVNKEKLSFVHPNGNEVKAWQNIKDMGWLYAGDGGTYTSNRFFKSLYGFLGVNKISKKSKNVIAQIDKNGTFFVKHLMYQPIFPDKGDGAIRIYENYGQNGEKLIGEIRSDGNIYGSPIPAVWSQKKLDDYIEEHKLSSKNANELLDFFTDDDGQGWEGLTNATEKVLEGLPLEDGITLHQKLEFIAAKEGLLREFVRKVANQAEVTTAEKRTMEVFDLLMTDDEMKVGTKMYEDMQKTGQTFEIDGKSVGILTATDDKHSYAPYPDQLGNYIRDPFLRDLFREHMLPSVTDKIESVFKMAFGNVGKHISEFMEYLRRGPFNAIDNITADAFELGLGMHPSGVGVVETAVQTRRVRPAQRMENMPGMTEDIEWDYSGTVKEDEVSVSAKNATIVYSAYASDPATDAQTNKEARQLPLKEINEWLDANEIWVLAYRAPTPHINGAAMMRIQSVHENADIVRLHPNTIFRAFEGDGDGDHFFMVLMPAAITDAYLAHYNRAEIRAKVKGVNLKEFAKQYEKDYDFTNIADRYELMSALMEGKKAIAEIAKTQRIYGQLLDTFDHVVVSEKGVQSKVVLVKPDMMLGTPKFKAGSKHTMEDILRIYVQAAVDNGKYMLLRKWGYNSERLRRSLFMQSNGDPITEAQWAAVRPLIRLHGRTGELRGGKDFNEGIFDFSTQIMHSKNYLAYMEDRKAGYFAELAKQPHFVRNEDGEILYTLEPKITDIVFTGETSIQEDIIVQTALLNRKYERAYDDGSPFRLMGYDDVIGEGISIYHMAHDESVHFIQEDKWDMMDIGISQEELNNAYHYAHNMYNAFGNMWENFRLQGLDPGFLGWSTNEDMVNFAEKWDKTFKKLSLAEQQIATYRFLEGVYRKTGKIRFIRQLPPISGRATGITTLDPDIMRKYLKKYNEVLQDKDNRSAPKVRDRTDFIEFEVEAHKKGCK